MKRDDENHKEIRLNYHLDDAFGNCYDFDFELQNKL